MTDATSSPKPVSVLVSADTKAHLSEKAKAGFRSLNREIAMRLEESVERERAKPANLATSTQAQGATA